LKLNLECIRSVLLTLEDKLVFTVKEGSLEKNCLSLNQLCDVMPDYSKPDIFYSLYNLDQAGYVNISVRWASGEVYSCIVSGMTYSGHEFLEEIRDSSKWGKVKSAASAVRDYSLSAISSIAEGVTSAAISAYFSKM